MHSMKVTQESKARAFFAEELTEDVLQYIERNNIVERYDLFDDDGKLFYIIYFNDTYKPTITGDITYDVTKKRWSTGMSKELDGLVFKTFDQLIQYTLTPLSKSRDAYIGCRGLDIDYESWEDEYNPTFPE